MMRRPPAGQGRLTTSTPTYNSSTKEFRQEMTFLTVHQIGEVGIERVLKHAERVFVGVLKMNGLTNYAWPPAFVHAEPHKDFRGADIVFMTRADHPKPTVLHS